jgi:hypothetical protein
MQKKRLESGAVVESGMKQLQKVCGVEEEEERCGRPYVGAGCCALEGVLARRWLESCPD